MSVGMSLKRMWHIYIYIYHIHCKYQDYERCSSSSEKYGMWNAYFFYFPLCFLFTSSLHTRFYAFHLLQTSVNPSLNFLISLSPFSRYINSAYRSVLSVLFLQVKVFHHGHKNVLLDATLSYIFPFYFLTPYLFEIHFYVTLFPTSSSSKLIL